LITFDDEIDPEWVENLNNVLDDNRRLALPTGETISLTSLMHIIIETADLTNTTPATISRCGIVYFQEDSLPLLAEFDAWLKHLPSVLEELVDRIKKFVEVMSSVIFDQMINKICTIYPMSRKWALINFIKVFDSMIVDYRSDKYRNWQEIEKSML
jgi:dynein heavy chain 1